MNAIPFDAIRAAALAQAPRLLRDWFPQGRLAGCEFTVGNLQGEPGESLSINVRTGKWCDFAEGGDSGFDLIDLRAAMRHSGDRVAAARELGAVLGITLNGHAARNERGLTRRDDDWQPMVPPPGDAPRPDPALFSGYDTAHEYCGADDRALFYVRRREARNGQRKLFHPLVYGRLNRIIGWHARHPASPRPLYGLNRLAAIPDAPVLLCEGEKAADAAQQLFVAYSCLSWFGGANAAGQADVSPLLGRNVIIWPDADDAGHKAAATLCKMLPEAGLLRVDDLPDGADAADVGAMVGDDPLGWLAARIEMPGEPMDADPDPPGIEPDVHAGLRDFLAIEAWADRDMPQPDRLLGDLVTTTSRMFLVGRTGLGKTMLGFGLAVGMASGRGFLHWRSARPARVLYIDGEMPGELIKARSIDALRRAFPPPPGNLMIYARDMEEAFAARFPMLGKMPPLNTEAGQNFVHALIGALGGVDVVIFDNVMSLIAGDQKDEVPWSDTLPLVSALTAKRIGQVWLDHAGHNTDRQYGSSTKAWRFDAVGVMTPLPDDQRQRHEVAFTLSFEHPGKARRRTPDNWADFETSTIRLHEDQWTSEPATGVRSETKLTPVCRQFYRALVDVLVSAEPAGRTTRAAWYAQCVRTGLADPVEPDNGYKARDAKQSKFRKYLIELKSNGLIGVDGETIHDLRRPA